MNVTYRAEYTIGVKPIIEKVIETSEGEVSTAISLYNVEDLKEISDAFIYQHMNNLLRYLKDYIPECTLVEPGVYPKNGLPIHGWMDVLKIQDEILSWWNYAEFREEEVQILAT